ncbi:BMP family lipoprotein [Amnibacterium kyonggiense]|uniref:Nucleoside-binding protein n=1 Tax=Amnibacterium kyonggiense TaxID=595671 RepID=A0A4R7FDI1_9MICO|nr:BMP family ABC transporter substrate-binding protein [Amnibacterium kyonggiense]TDS75019.1 nucleoside-binding protein [Amnibacterium kyonggiense]
MTSLTKRIGLGAVAALGTVALLTGCGSAPSATSSASKSTFLPCVVGDVGGFNDHSFNELSLEGVQAAAKQIGTTAKKVQSQTSTDYAPAFASLVAQKCNSIVAAGFQFGDPLVASAKANPKIDYVMIDNTTTPELPNVKDVVFKTSEAAFLGGYAAAAYADSVSKTPAVATYGGQKFPTVTIFMDGVADGVAYYNTQKKKSVKLLGWNVKSQNGSFVGNFTDQNKSKQIASGFLDQGANVIIPVAGSLYQGAYKAIGSGDAVLEGVDADVFQSDATVKDKILTSIVKKVDLAAQTATSLAASGKFDNSTYIGDLKNGGVALAPFHDYESKVPSSLSSELDTIKAGIIDGSITVDSPAATTLK